MCRITVKDGGWFLGPSDGRERRHVMAMGILVDSELPELLVGPRSVTTKGAHERNSGVQQSGLAGGADLYLRV